MTFQYESEPPRTVAVPIAPGIRRAVAANPGRMTYHGTNTYFIEAPAGRYVLDPGPAEDEAHFRFVLAQSAGFDGIMVSHHHSDHFGTVARLREATGMPVIAFAQFADDTLVPVIAFAQFADDTFEPDIGLADGDDFAGFAVLHTPGHASDHLCFARASDGLLLSGDHVMGWNSSIVARPDGDMAAYFAQLQRLIARDDRYYLPGHGPRIDNPQPYVQRLLSNRVRREAEIIEALRQRPWAPNPLAAELYRKTDPRLARAAERNVEAHLFKLESEGRAIQEAGIWRAP